MEGSPYRFLFPFERVPKGSRVLIYGAGRVGQAFLEQVTLSRYCEVVAMADQNFASYAPMIVPVIDPAEIPSYAYEFLVIAMNTGVIPHNVEDVLDGLCIPKEKIVFVGQREMPSIFLPEAEAAATDGEKTHEPRAYELSEQSMLVYTTGGYGDQIIQKSVIEAFVRSAPDTCIDMYHGKRAAAILPFLYEDLPQVKNFDLVLGTRYDREKGNYAAAIQFGSNARVHVDVLKSPSAFPEVLYGMLKRLQAHERLEERERNVMTYVDVMRSRYKKENRYERLACNGIIPIRGQKVHIPEDENAKRAFEKMEIGTYITMNYGNGNAKNAAVIGKSWPCERFEAVIRLLHERHPGIGIVQIGEKDAKHLAGADRYILGKSFAFVAQVLKHAMLHIDIEGGLVHLATQLDTKCIVLFGQTAVDFYGYPQNINLHAGDCQACNGLYHDSYRCARGMKEPECMYSITPEMVMEAAENVLSRKGR